MNIIASKKSIKLYVFPEELVGDNPTIIHAQSSLPPVLPTIIQRSDKEPLKKVNELFQWFQENLSRIVGGCLVASAALPALSLDRGLWNIAVKDLSIILSDYQTIEGPIYVPSIGCTRSNQFGVSDWYRSRLHGSVTVAVAVVKKPKPEVEAVPAERVVLNNHVVSNDIGINTVEKEA